MQATLREALDALVKGATDPEDRETIRGLAHAVALILTVEVNPDTNPETVKLTDASRAQLTEALRLGGHGRAREYRCTRALPYSENTTGYTDTGSRQGYYIVALSQKGAIREMVRRFPKDTLYDRPTFTAEEWRAEVSGRTPVEHEQREGA